MDVRDLVQAKARAARDAARALALCPTKIKNDALVQMAHGLVEKAGSLLEANRADVEGAQGGGATRASLDRLTLTESRLEEMAQGLREIAALPDPVGTVVEVWGRPNGIEISRVRVPLGVVGFIYESRPNVTADAAGLCVKSGNAVILRGGSEAIDSNTMIAAVLAKAVEKAGGPADAIQFIETTDREAVAALLELGGLVDLIIPRGGEEFVRWVAERSRIPVLKHDKGLVHVFVDASADPAMAAQIVVNAKAQRPGVCNALETLLVHREIAPRLLPALAARLAEAGVEGRGRRPGQCVHAARGRLAVRHGRRDGDLDLARPRARPRRRPRADDDEVRRGRRRTGEGVGSACSRRRTRLGSHGGLRRVVQPDPLRTPPSRRRGARGPRPRPDPLRAGRPPPAQVACVLGPGGGSLRDGRAGGGGTPEVRGLRPRAAPRGAVVHGRHARGAPHPARGPVPPRGLGDVSRPPDVARAAADRPPRPDRRRAPGGERLRPRERRGAEGGARDRRRTADRARDVPPDLGLRPEAPCARGAVRGLPAARVGHRVHPGEAAVSDRRGVTRLTAERKVRRAARAALDKRATDLIVLDVQGLSSVTDYFLVCNGKSTTHMETITDAIRDELKREGVRPLHAEGVPASGWILLDYGDVLVHVFLEETRAYYALERLWGDAPAVSLDGS